MKIVSCKRSQYSIVNSLSVKNIFHPQLPWQPLAESVCLCDHWNLGVEALVRILQTQDERCCEVSDAFGRWSANIGKYRQLCHIASPSVWNVSVSWLELWPLTRFSLVTWEKRWKKWQPNKFPRMLKPIFDMANWSKSPSVSRRSHAMSWSSMPPRMGEPSSLDPRLHGLRRSHFGFLLIGALAMPCHKAPNMDPSLASPNTPNSFRWTLWIRWASDQPGFRCWPGRTSPKVVTRKIANLAKIPQNHREIHICLNKKIPVFHCFPICFPCCMASWLPNPSLTVSCEVVLEPWRVEPRLMKAF